MKDTSHTVGWMALLIAVIALILAWTAFNRSGRDLEVMVNDQVEEAVESMRQEFEQAEEAVREGTANTLESGADAATDAAEDVRN